MRCAASMGMPRSAASLGEANGTTKRERERDRERCLCVVPCAKHKGRAGREAGAKKQKRREI